MNGTGNFNGRQNRNDRLIKEKIHDPYMTRSKPSEPTACPDCGVTFSDGRWQWAETELKGARQELCPACQRIRDKYPAGILTLKGDFFLEHRREIMNLVNNKVKEQKSAHPMKRMMGIEDSAEGSILTFTDTHLPRGVGQAIERAYEGQLEIQYTQESDLVRVNWQR